jgi:uncharacterized protein
VRREPLGVVAAITPWNYPQVLAMFKIAPALAAGCTIVLKPSPETALDSYILGDAATEAGIQPGVLNIVLAGRETGAALVTHPLVDKIAFTGSTAAGRIIGATCGKQIRRCTVSLAIGPVKSLLGEDLPAIKLDEKGVRGDRLWALRTSAGRIGAGKCTRRYVRLPHLLEMAARLDEDGETPIVQIDGRELRSGEPALDELLSAVVGEPVVLAQETDTPHRDAEPVHLVTTAALRWWSDRVPEEKTDWRRLRPNLVVDVPGIGRVEDDWVGRRLRVGRTVLRVVEATERCLMLPQDQLGLGHAPQLLRALARHGLTLGVYARVFIPGTVNRGDPVVLD